MAGVNQVFSLADDVARYVKACGKRSILETMRIRTKINPKELGYICSNGDINFQSTKAASKYAKTWVIQPLRKEKPYERFVAQHKNVIFYRKEGDAYSTMIDDIDMQKILSRFNSNISIVHGHPNLPNFNIANPLTWVDCIFLFKNKSFKDIIAYDCEGNFSKLVKINSNKKLPKNFLQNFEEFVYPKKLIQRQNELIEKMQTTSWTNTDELEFIEVMKKLQEVNAKQTARHSHEFWVNHADGLGLDYSTNYSWLV